MTAFELIGLALVLLAVAILLMQRRLVREIVALRREIEEDRPLSDSDEWSET